MDQEVRLPVPGAELAGRLSVPPGASCVVLFAHGSGSSRHSPRNRYVADHLNSQDVGTLLLDLLTPQEADDRTNVFDVPMLASRLLAATRWLAQRRDTAGLPTGYFGASTGAAAALWAAAEPRCPVGAVVSRGGRPDLAGERLGRVRAPTLLIVGGADRQVLVLNRRAQAQMSSRTALEVVPGAGHLFEEPGALEHVSRLAASWFVRFLPGEPVPGADRASG